MKITLLPSTLHPSGATDFQYASSYLVNDSIAIDAGTLGFYGSVQQQEKVRHVLITHTHIDHIATLPIFIENAYTAGPECVTVHGSQTVLDCLQNDVFNNRLWPDFIELSKHMPPFLKLSVFEPGETREIDGLRVEAIAIDHVVPTSAFLLTDSGGSVLLVTDTGPTEAVWLRANQLTDLRAVFLEVTFPNSMAYLAGVSRHLTPDSFAGELLKLKHKVPVYAIHLKGRMRQRVVDEIVELDNPLVKVAETLTQYGWKT